MIKYRNDNNIDGPIDNDDFYDYIENDIDKNTQGYFKNKKCYERVLKELESRGKI